MVASPLPDAGARGREQGCGRGQGAGQGRGSRATVSKVGMPDGHKRCKIWEQMLPDSYLPPGRAICTDDDKAVENLQRVLRTNWGNIWQLTEAGQERRQV